MFGKTELMDVNPEDEGSRPVREKFSRPDVIEFSIVFFLGCGFALKIVFL